MLKDEDMFGDEHGTELPHSENGEGNTFMAKVGSAIFWEHATVNNNREAKIVLIRD